MPGKCHKILVEVRLIIEAGFLREQGPIDRPCWINRAEDVHKPVETRQFLRRDTDHPLELCPQMVLADADVITRARIDSAP
jgi:hypothetical protein